MTDFIGPTSYVILFNQELDDLKISKNCHLNWHQALKLNLQVQLRRSWKINLWQSRRYRLRRGRHQSRSGLKDKWIKGEIAVECFPKQLVMDKFQPLTGLRAPTSRCRPFCNPGYSFNSFGVVVYSQPWVGITSHNPLKTKHEFTQKKMIDFFCSSPSFFSKVGGSYNFTE